MRAARPSAGAASASRLDDNNPAKLHQAAKKWRVGKF
jgi:hypothetical protein